MTPRESEPVVTKGGELEYVYRETTFLNLDVDVLSLTRLDPLAAALGRQVMVHYIGREGRHYAAHFSLYNPSTADRAVKTLAPLIVRFPAPARRCWNRARRRVFNIGLQAGASSPGVTRHSSAPPRWKPFFESPRRTH
ncbi:MAG: hypothetical protein LC804_07520 [Acidobacteria bacterium]|nr:hypothetical protein [Acidobacteriota bacterium]